MQVLIAILSCHSLRHCEQAERDTWIKEIPSGVDYKFFLGNREGIHDASLHLYAEDEVHLDVGDGWNDITAKTVAMQLWALSKGYDFVYKCDLDTLVRPKLLLESDYSLYDYVGGKNGYFASGGSGYWLSNKAMRITTQHAIRTGPEEDVHVATSLSAHGIQVHDDRRYLYYPGDVMDDETISYHLASIRSFGPIKYDPDWMYQTWEDQKNRDYKSYCTGTPPPRPMKVETVDPNRRTIRFRRLR